MKKISLLYVFYTVMLLLCVVITFIILNLQTQINDNGHTIIMNTKRIEAVEIDQIRIASNSVPESGDIVEEIESEYLNLFDDGWSPDSNLYCVSGLGEAEGGYQELIGYYLTKDGIEHKNVVVADVWLQEQAGGCGCLVANMKEGYCSYLPEITMNDNRPGMVGSNISSEFSEKALDDRYRDNRKSTYYYCNELSETQKYNQTYTIGNVMAQYDRTKIDFNN